VQAYILKSLNVRVLCCCVCIFMCVHIYVCIFMCVHIYVRVEGDMQAHILKSLNVCVFVCVMCV